MYWHKQWVWTNCEDTALISDRWISGDPASPNSVIAYTTDGFQWIPDSSNGYHSVICQKDLGGWVFLINKIIKSPSLYEL